MKAARFAALGAIFVFAHPAFAADEIAEPGAPAETYPYVEGALELSLGDDWVVSSDDPGAEINDLFLEGALGLKFGLFPGLAINAGLTLEPVLDPDPFDDRWFGDHGLYVDTLNAEVTLGGLVVTAGKFGPGFGTAWDITPGIYGTNFAEDYETAEQLGFGAAYSFETATAGTHTLGANLFTADTTFLSESAFTNRGRTRVSDGGVGNTGQLDNFSITLDGEEIPALPGLRYHAGFRYLSPGVGDMTSEKGYVLGLARETELANGMVLGLNGEVAYFDDFGGTRDDAVYVTAGLVVVSGPWHGELAGTIRNIDFAGAGDTTDHLLQVSGGYTFQNGVDVSLGYGYTRAAAVDTHFVGVRVSKAFVFSTRN